jgi:SWI/SNF-related matrix-associated actin-dependent regulator 1 of chromatin subfamily A
MTEPLRSFQRNAAKILASNPTAFLAHFMGAGKSRTVIEAVRELKLSRVLVIAPAIGRVSWPDQLRKWEDPASVFLTPTAVPFRPPSVSAKRLWVIVSYDSISRSPVKWREFLRDCLEPEAIVLDEARALKTPDSARTVAIYGRNSDAGPDAIIHKCPHVWALDGTPAPNFTSELWTHLHALTPARILSPSTSKPMPYHEFTGRYSTVRDTIYGPKVTGSRNTPELRTRTGGFFDTVHLQDVLPELPPLSVDTEPLDARVDPASVPTLAVPDDVSDDNLLAWLSDNATNLSAERKALGLLKVPAAIEWIEAFFDATANTRKLIVFAHHREVLEALHTGLKATLPVVYGGTPTHARDHAVNRFQNDPAHRLFLGQTLAAGSAITLTAARDVVAVEGDWNPSNLRQAFARAHRMGQLHPVMARILYIAGTLDERIARVAASKTRAISQMFDNQEAKEPVT